MLNIGDFAPDFELTDQNGTSHRLSDYRGKKVVLYFYPKDNTPGCTKEACSFRDSFEDYKKHGIVVLGVSKDSEASHTRFIEKFSLPFTLLADTQTAVCQAYGVWGLKKSMGREYYGINRMTFVIDEEGKILKIYEKVKPEDHAKEILRDIGIEA
jgi:peroxiredoxin Q/BCP